MPKKTRERGTGTGSSFSSLLEFLMDPFHVRRQADEMKALLIELSQRIDTFIASHPLAHSHRRYTEIVNLRVPTQDFLDSCVGEHISSFCENGYTADSLNHCAHFVGHAIQLGIGYTCQDATGGTGFGASLRVHEVFASCVSVGRWEDLPSPVNWGLIFITNPANVDLASKTMKNVPKKHVGIFFGGGPTVYQYKNAVKHVVRQTPDEFSRHYSPPDNGLFYGLPTSV